VLKKILVIGGGPAGMMAAIAAASTGQASVILLEKNEKLGKKLYITGKGRCNLTNATDTPGLLRHIVKNGRFLYSAFNQLDAAGLMAFFEARGVPLKIERGNRVFPASDKSNDINRALEAALREAGVRVHLNEAVDEITIDGIAPPSGSTAAFAVHTRARVFFADAVVVATGGLSYPSTGSAGDGYRFARAAGHEIVPTFPSLVSLTTAEAWPGALEGLSLRNVRLIAALPNGKTLYSEMGEMLFTRDGITGPLALSASAYLADKMHENPTLAIDMKPALDADKLDARILRDFADAPNKDFANILGGLVPSRMAQVVAALADIPVDTKVNAITKTQRAALVRTLKTLPLTPTGTAGYREAVITRGGIDTRELNPSTLMSKKIPDLYFAGECLDVDALTGGYNLQIAFSTGWLAGLSAASHIR